MEYKKRLELFRKTHFNMGWLRSVGSIKLIGIFCRIASLLQVSFAKETYNFIDPTKCRHPIYERGQIYARFLSQVFRGGVRIYSGYDYSNIYTDAYMFAYVHTHAYTYVDVYIYTHKHK